MREVDLDLHAGEVLAERGRRRMLMGVNVAIGAFGLVMAALVMWLGVSREDLVKPEKKAGAAGIEKILP